jgi:hypothetical protein
MNEGNESFPSTETQKKKRCFGFRYSSRKALERSRLTRRIAKTGRFELTSITMALLYPNAFSSKKSIMVFDHHGCVGVLARPPYFESIDEVEGERKEMSIGNEIIDGEYPQRVRNI